MKTPYSLLIFLLSFLLSFGHILLLCLCKPLRCRAFLLGVTFHFLLLLSSFFASVLCVNKTSTLLR